MKNAKRATLIICLITVFCILMAIIDGIIKANYFTKSIIKFVMFLILPAIYAVFDRNIKLKELFIPDKKGIKFAIFLGVLVPFMT